MKKLNKTALASRGELMQLLQTRADELEAAVSGFNDTMQEAWSEVEAAVEAYNAKLDEAWGNSVEPAANLYNEAISEANAWRQDAIDSITEYMDARSEKWQEGEAGQRYSEWRDAFDQEFPESEVERPDDLSIDSPDEISFDNENPADLLEQLPEEIPE